MATCPNGHTNPDNQEFCRECGTPIMSAVVTCPHGHINPEHAHFCEECGTPLFAPVAAVPPSPKTRPRYRKKWVIAVASIVTLAVIAGGVVAAVVLTKSKEQASSSAPTTSAAMAIKNWWSGAQQDFADLQKAMVDARAAASRFDIPAFADACQRMHETAANKLQAHLPSPDPELTADLQGAIADAQTAAHSCFAAKAGANEQFGEFISNLDQAEKQMRAAQDIVNKTLKEA